MHGQPDKRSKTTPEDAFATRAVHAGQLPSQWSSRAVVPPISMATTFEQPEPAKPVSYDYGRSGNPTRTSLEDALAQLENGKHALVFASGLAANTSISYLLRSGDHVVCSDDVYGGTARFLRHCASRAGIETTFVDETNVDAIVNAIQPGVTKMLWLESPTNPMLKFADLEQIVSRVRAAANDVMIVVDNTFMTPYFQQPLKYGVDIVVHSLTKYINGHSDVVMGGLVTNNADIHSRLSFLQNSLGAVPSPFDCFLANRGLKTLSLRMERHQENAFAIAKHLEGSDKVEKVIYPGLSSHPQHELVRKQCTGYSGILSFYLKGDLDVTRKFLSQLRLFTLAESLGAVESLIEIPALMTHASVPKDIRQSIGITDTLIRVSVGVESSVDLINDMEQALGSI